MHVTCCEPFGGGGGGGFVLATMSFEKSVQVVVNSGSGGVLVVIFGVCL